MLIIHNPPRRLRRQGGLDMKKTNSFVMHVRQTDSKGNKVTGHLIIDAKTFDEAKVNVEEKCRELNGKVLNLTYTPLGTGYRLEVGGGCKW